MRLNKLFKGLAVALPVMALTACGSTSSTKTGTDSSTSNDSAVTSTTDTTSGVETGSVSQVDSFETQQMKKMEALRKEHILYFDFDKSNIDSDFYELLDAHASFLRDNTAVKVLIEGHADERGTPEYNIALGERRAKAVSKYLQNSGVAASQISIVSYGEEKPMVRTRTADAFAKNRRAVLVY